MFSHRSFLVLGEEAADIVSLVKGGHEVLDCNFSFQQAVDSKGKATSKVYGGTMDVTVAKLPTQEMIEWALQSRNYKDGVIVMLNNENIPIEKIFFKNAACVGFEIDYTQKGDSYVITKMLIQAEKLVVGNGVDFDNEWTF